MLEKQKHIQKIYTEKAIAILKICIVILIFGMTTYIIPFLIYEEFDFGIIFEIISFIFVFIAIIRIGKEQIQVGKRNIIIAMISIGWITIYDGVCVIFNIEEVIIDFLMYFFRYSYVLGFIMPFIYEFALIVLLYKAYCSLGRVDGTRKENNFTESFYDEI